MTDIICPLCGKPNPPDLDECQYCQAPLKTGGFLASTEGEAEYVPPLSEKVEKPADHTSESESIAKLEQAVPDWLKETEASFLEPSESTPEESDQIAEQIDSLLNTPSSSPEAPENAIDDDWLESLLVEAGALKSDQPETIAGKPDYEESGISPQEPGDETTEASEAELSAEETAPFNEEEYEEQPAVPTSPDEKPDWLANLEASSKIKLEGITFEGEPEQLPPIPVELPEENAVEPTEPPEWLTTPSPEPEAENLKEAEAPIAPAELPGWLEAIRPSDTVSPTGPVEDVSRAEIVTAGPLMGLRGVISANPSAFRAQKPPTYSIKLKVTPEQQARLQMMEELLADEEKPKPLPTEPIITSRRIFRVIVAVVLLLPMIWMIISNRQQSSAPQPGNIPGVIDFTQQLQRLPDNAVVLIAFDYEAGFSGEVNIAITNVLTQLMKKSAYLTIVATKPSGPALAESIIQNSGSTLTGNVGKYSNYANLGYIPGGTIGLLGLAKSPRNILPYALDGSNVWAGAPLDAITSIKNFAAVIVITNDADTARIWIEQVGSQLHEAATPLLFITSAQAEPLIRPYYEATPTQVQGMLAGLTGGIAYARTLGNYQQNGIWDAYSAGITISILIILIGSIAGVVMKLIVVEKKKEP
jgi:hypothetical protein